MSSASIPDGWDEGLGFELYKGAEEGIGTDVIFEVGPAKRVFHAHQFLMGFGSPLLKNVLKEAQEINGKKVLTVNADPRSFRYLLKGMYDWKSTELTQHENDPGLILSTFRLAHRLEVATVMRKYIRFFIQDVKRRTLMREGGLIPKGEGQVIQYLNDAVKMKCNELKKITTQYLCRYWYYLTALENNDDWLKLSAESLQEILVQDTLVHWSELFVYEDVRRWIKARIDGVSDVQAKVLLRTVRFPLMTVKELREVIRDGLLDSEDVTWIQEFMIGMHNERSFLKFKANDRVEVPLPLPEPNDKRTPTPDHSRAKQRCTP